MGIDPSAVIWEQLLFQKQFLSENDKKKEIIYSYGNDHEKDCQMVTSWLIKMTSSPLLPLHHAHSQAVSESPKPFFRNSFLVSFAQ